MTSLHWTHLYFHSTHRDSAYFEEDGSRKGYELESYDSLIKRKYWEVIKEKHKQEIEKQNEENIKNKKRRIILDAIEAFRGLK